MSNVVCLDKVRKAKEAAEKERRRDILIKSLKKYLGEDQ